MTGKRCWIVNAPTAKPESSRSSESGMFVLTGEFDQITGARIATALTAKERQLWHREDPKARATPQQRMADALAELICEPASGPVRGH